MRIVPVLLLLASAVWPQVAQEANRNYETPEQRARIAEGLESPARPANLKRKQLVSSLTIQPGSTVVDLGPGNCHGSPAAHSKIGASFASTSSMIAVGTFSSFLPPRARRSRARG
jgi:hypothetical protein